MGDPDTPRLARGGHRHASPFGLLYLVFYAGDLSLETDGEPAQRAHERQRETLKITMQ